MRIKVSAIQARLKAVQGKGRHRAKTVQGACTAPGLHYCIVQDNTGQRQYKGLVQDNAEDRSQSRKKRDTGQRQHNAIQRQYKPMHGAEDRRQCRRVVLDSA